MEWLHGKSGLAALQALFLVPCLVIAAGLVDRTTVLPAESQNFMRLAPVLDQTSPADMPTVERLKALTQWLHTRLTHESNPALARQAGLAADDISLVLHGKTATSEQQANAVIVMAQMLKVRNSRRVHFSDPMLQLDPNLWHVMAEVEIDGKWALFDPDRYLFFQQGPRLLSLADVLALPDDKRPGDLNRLIHAATPDLGGIQSTSVILSAPLPLGQASQGIYESVGPVLTTWLLAALSRPGTWLLVAMGLNLVAGLILARAFPKPSNAKISVAPPAAVSAA